MQVTIFLSLFIVAAQHNVTHELYKPLQTEVVCIT